MAPELSRTWAQDEPFRAVVGLRDLDELYAECPEKQRKRREVAFAQARRFIENARAANGIGPTEERFPRKNRDGQYPDARIDIHVMTGLAFVP